MGQASAAKAPCLYRSMICFILQGSKHVQINDALLSYDPAHYLISALELPLTGQILDDQDGRPYVAVSLILDPALLADVASTMAPVRDADAQGIGIAINPMTAPLRDSLLRLLTLLDTPADIPGLAPMAERELLYRLLQGPQGRLLRQIAQPEGALGRIRRAAGWIRDNHSTRLRIEALCEASGMSRASLHRHFQALTGLSPLQYQKQLRLQEARQLLLAGDSASDVAFAIGYESASQFSREYLRQFGAPPARDVRQIREAIGSPAGAERELSIPLDSRGVEATDSPVAQPSSSTASDTAKRADIVAAAITEFRIRGFGGARVDEIAEKAKVSKRTLYRYFASKGKLFDEIVRLALTQHPPEADGAYDPDRPVHDQLRELIDAYLDVVSANEYIALARVVTVEFIRQPELAKAAAHNAPEDRFAHFFASAMAAGAMRAAEPRHAAMQLTALLKAFFFWPAFLQDAPLANPAEQSRLRDDCLAMFLNHYLAR